MLALMAYPPSPSPAASESGRRPTSASSAINRGDAPVEKGSATRGTRTTTAGESAGNVTGSTHNTSMTESVASAATSHSLNDAAPQSVLTSSSSSESLAPIPDDHGATACALGDYEDQDEEKSQASAAIQRRASCRCCDPSMADLNSRNDDNQRRTLHNESANDLLQGGEDGDHDVTRRPTFLQQMEDVPRVYMEKLYENTVDGPCQTVSLCEVRHMDLFVNCQPGSFFGFGHDPRSAMRESTHSNNTPSDPLDGPETIPMAGAYTVPKGCEYCGSATTKHCCRLPSGRSPSCPRPMLYFQKKRPPFAPPDPDIWDPDTDDFIEPYVLPEEQPPQHGHALHQFSSGSLANTIVRSDLDSSERNNNGRLSGTARENQISDEEVQGESNRQYWMRSLFGGSPPTA